MNPRVQSATPLEGYRLYIEFNNGEKGVYDCASLLDFGVFKELRNTQYFNKVTVIDGTVVWPHEQDICPDTLYLDCQKIAEQGA
jgi:hypothetical protein